MPKRESKLTDEQHRNLVEEYNIHFDGPIPPSCWPAAYVKVFENIRDIERLRYDEYGPNERRGMLTVADMKDRVLRLNRIAYNCRKERENEATWRGLTEPEIISRFDAEVACRACRKRLWDSEFKALPDDPIEARKLRQRRARRTLCNCSVEARASEDINDHGGAPLFSSRLQRRFIYDPADNLGERGIGSQEPDRVFGLRDTKAFKEYMSARGGLRKSPFSDGKVLYPFLIIESKSEKGSPGFESIENQTAFPIRSLLKLQKDLNSASATSIKPLVWFLANQGDEWRAYGSISDESKWRVIDLWHGTILSQDRALQLLLILDYICDWARDIYRLDVLRCLANGDVDMRDTTPAYSIISSLEEESNDVPDSTSLLTPRAISPEEPSLIDLTLDAEGNDTDMEDISLIGGDNSSLSSIDSIVVHPLLRFSWSHNEPNHWSKHATIRHSDLVLFSFRHATLPEDRQSLRAWLKSFPDEDLLLSTLIRDTAPVTITMNGVLQLENMWTRTTHQSSPENDNPILAWIWFHSYFESWDWQVVRELLCITISRPAFEELVNITGIARSPHEMEWTAHACHCLKKNAQSLRFLCGRESTISAASKLALLLTRFLQDNGETHFRWATPSEIMMEGADRTYVWRSVTDKIRHNAVNSGLTVRSGELLEELFPGQVVPPFLKTLIRIPARFGKQGAALLMKPADWPAVHSPIYCLMVFDETPFDDEDALREKIVQLFNAGDLYQPHDEELRRIAVAGYDIRLINVWTNVLSRKLPYDTDWVLEGYDYWPETNPVLV